MMDQGRDADVTETRGSTAATPERGRDEPRLGFLARISLFYRQVISELRKVIWPNRRELVTYTSVVLVFVTAIIAIVSILDFALGKGVLAILG
jgi:preprotein translocase subunit SecE